MIVDKINARPLQWLGHVSRMRDRIPRQLLFSSLSSTRPPHGPRKRWKVTVKTDHGAIGINQAAWIGIASERGEWRDRCKESNLCELEMNQWISHLHAQFVDIVFNNTGTLPGTSVQLSEPSPPATRLVQLNARSVIDGSVAGEAWLLIAAPLPG